MSDLLTMSRMRTHRRCNRRELIEYQLGWRTVEQPEALAFGILWHQGMEAWWNAQKDGRTAEALTDALAITAGKARDVYEQARVDAMLRGYDAKWRDHDLTVLAVEEEFRAPLVNPATMAISRTWRLGGKIDARARHQGRHIIVEHKTAGTDITPGSEYWIKLQMDPQLSIYTIGAEALGFPPEGTLYDVAKKVALRPMKATPPESRKFTQKGALYANMRAEDETPAEYAARVWAEIDNNLDTYFQRREIPRTESQLREFLDDAWAQAKLMQEGRLTGRAPRNPDACHAYGGTCPWWPACSAGVELADYPTKYRRIEWAHPELSSDADV